MVCTPCAKFEGLLLFRIPIGEACHVQQARGPAQHAEMTCIFLPFQPSWRDPLMHCFEPERLPLDPRMLLVSIHPSIFSNDCYRGTQAKEAFQHDNRSLVEQHRAQQAWEHFKRGVVLAAVSNKRRQ